MSCHELLRAGFVLAVWTLGSGLERLLLNHTNTPGFLAPRGEEFNPGPETGLIAQSFCVIKFY